MKAQLIIYRSLILMLCLSHDLRAITLVYSMRIRRAFNIAPILKKDKKSLWALTVLPIIYTRNRKIPVLGSNDSFCEKRTSGGTILDGRWVLSKYWWVEFTTGLEKEHVSTKGATSICDSRFGMDDIVLTGGRNFYWGDHTQFVVYGLAGFPTRTKVTAQEVYDTLVGTRFFSVGVGSELSYAFISSLERSLIGTFQNRFLHFFSRSWTTILGPGGKIQPGNATDILFSLQYREKREIFEAGINPTFFTNQAAIKQCQKISSDPFVRQSIFAQYRHICKKPQNSDVLFVWGAGCNFGWSKKFDTKISSYFINVSAIF